MRAIIVAVTAMCLPVVASHKIKTLAPDGKAWLKPS